MGGLFCSQSLFIQGEFITCGTAIRRLRNRLALISESAWLDSQVLVMHVTGKPKSWLFAHQEAVLGEEIKNALQEGLWKVENGQPLPYVIGSHEFYGIQFTVTPDTLIPRPETELIVDWARHWLNKHPDASLLADVGTGSGCIAIAIAKTIRDIHISAVDISLTAIKVAKDNAFRHQVADRIDFIQADLLTSVYARFDLVCANLPYIPTEVLHSLEIIGHEPTIALDGGDDGLKWIKPLILDSPRWLKPGGVLLLEIEEQQGPFVSEIVTMNLPNWGIDIQKDLADRDRLCVVASP